MTMKIPLNTVINQERNAAGAGSGNDEQRVGNVVMESVSSVQHRSNSKTEEMARAPSRHHQLSSSHHMTQSIRQQSPVRKENSEMQEKYKDQIEERSDDLDNQNEEANKSSLNQRRFNNPAVQNHVATLKSSFESKNDYMKSTLKGSIPNSQSVKQHSRSLAASDKLIQEKQMQTNPIPQTVKNGNSTQHPYEFD